VKDFVTKYLVNPEWANEKETKEGWNVKGILKDRSNEVLKFDLRPAHNYKQGAGKIGKMSSKANKMVFEAIDKWIIIDMEELKRHVLKTKSPLVNLEFVLKNLDWNIEIKK
tara:strand:+ start:309 stop:641 length:333 start_codon:yes stop_codon:yes gene_type:complete